MDWVYVTFLFAVYSAELNIAIELLLYLLLVSQLVGPYLHRVSIHPEVASIPKEYFMNLNYSATCISMSKACFIYIVLGAIRSAGRSSQVAAILSSSSVVTHRDK